MSEPTKNRGYINLGLAVQAREIYDETGLTPCQMQEQNEKLRHLVANLSAIVRAQNGNLHDDVNALLATARSALANTERKTA